MWTDLSGQWQVQLKNGDVYPAKLPGTLDENQIGEADSSQKPMDQSEEAGVVTKDQITSRLTRKFVYTGSACYQTTLKTVPEGQRLFLKVERSRYLTLTIDGQSVPDFLPATLITPHVFEVSGLLHPGAKIALTCDNSYPTWPSAAIEYASTATDETQTNWNGLLGQIGIASKPETFISALRVYPHKQQLHAVVEIDSQTGWQGTLTVKATASLQPQTLTIDAPAGRSAWQLDLPLEPGAKMWDEGQGNLQTATAALTNGDEKTVQFGVREIGAVKRRLALNGRIFFLRGEANCAVFPETGYPPMTVDAWRKIIRAYQAYGINCLRFHTYTPPEAAFTAADELGMLMQPELSHWDPDHAFETPESATYYRRELMATVRFLANHPSFVMLTFGNELCNDQLGALNMGAMITQVKQLDDTRLYAVSSNYFYGGRGPDAVSDFYTSQGFHDRLIRGSAAGPGSTNEDAKTRNAGHLNNDYPSANHNYSAVLGKLRQQSQLPVYNFEVGQYTTFPDFGELKEFKGVTAPVNYEVIQRRVQKRGLTKVWPQYVAASGALSQLSYREEIEAVLRTPEMSGISLLGVQDFTGQGMALTGMMNAHLQVKPYPFADPALFRKTFSAALPLVLLPKYTYTNAEILEAPVQVANYGRQEQDGPWMYQLAAAGRVLANGTFTEQTAPIGQLTTIGAVTLDFSQLGLETPIALTLTVLNDQITNDYPLWVYPAKELPRPAGIYETEHFDKAAQAVLAEGGKVLLAPIGDLRHQPTSVPTNFTTDFWNALGFTNQTGTMGQLIASNHPLFKYFPTAAHTDWQWWPMAASRAMVLPRPIDSLITEMDNFATLRPMTQLFEAQVGGGKLLVSSMDLQDLSQYPEARALRQAIYRYMDSADFDPSQKLSADFIAGLVH